MSIESQNHIGTLIFKNGNFNPFIPAPIGEFDRITEDGVTRITEDGVTRITEESA